MLKIYIYWHKCWCNGCGTDGTSEDRATQLLICEPLSFANTNIDTNTDSKKNTETERRRRTPVEFKSRNLPTFDFLRHFPQIFIKWYKAKGIRPTKINWPTRPVKRRWVCGSTHFQQKVYRRRPYWFWDISTRKFIEGMFNPGLF